MLHCQNKAVNIHVPFFGTGAQECSLLHVGVYLVLKKLSNHFQSDYASLHFQWQCLKDLFSSRSCRQLVLSLFFILAVPIAVLVVSQHSLFFFFPVFWLCHMAEIVAEDSRLNTLKADCSSL